MWQNKVTKIFEDRIKKLGIGYVLILDQGSHFDIWFSNQEDLNFFKLSGIISNPAIFKARVKGIDNGKKI